MTETEDLTFLVRELLKERGESCDIELPKDRENLFNLYRGLCNLRLPAPGSEKFLLAEHRLLQQCTKEKGITDAADLKPVLSDTRLFLRQGDITTLRCGAIVNAANSGMLGCFRPLHGCIDNIIHTMAGVELRNECARQMDALRKEKGKDYKRPVAEPLITPAYNLPARYVIHVAGPMVEGTLTDRERNDLARCYQSSMALAAAHHVREIAFCCISTGVFHFPPEEAAKIAVKTVKQYLYTHKDGSLQQVIFNVFTNRDREIYEQLLNR